MSLSRIVEHHADRAPERPALGFGDESVTYGDLHARALRTAGALSSSGIVRGDVVAALLHNSLDFVDVMLGVSYLGAVFMPLNWRLAPPELEYIVDHAGAVAFVSEPGLLQLAGPAAANLDCRSFLICGDDAGDGWEALGLLRDNADPIRSAEPVAPSDLMRLMYTSGTTARPKGVMISYGNLDAKCLAHTVELGLGRDDRSVIAGPLYHVGALDLSFTSLLYLGGYQRILPRFDPGAVLEAIEQERVTTLWLAPAMVKLVLDDPLLAERDLTSVRVLIDGGEKMPLPLIERVLEAFPAAWFADAYGLTETVSGDTFLNKGEERNKLGSVGKPVFNVEVAVVDVDDNPVPPRVEGEIVIRGPKVCAGYWRDPDATERAMRGGWFHTGDVGVIDDDGYLYIVDRIKDMILSGGENVASLEVERVLYEHPDVAEAAVVGRPDERWGEVPVAFVVAREGATVDAQSLMDFAAQRLAKFKTPKGVYFVNELPRNPSGKVLKRELRHDLHALALEAH